MVSKERRESKEDRWRRKLIMMVKMTIMKTDMIVNEKYGGDNDSECDGDHDGGVPIFHCCFMTSLASTTLIRSHQQRQKKPCLMAALPPGKFLRARKVLRVTMKSTIKRHAKMHRFLDGL